MFFNQLSFLAPEWLGFLLVLPVLWWLLRLLPPTPRKIVLPTIMLLKHFTVQAKTPEKPPWWLLFVRLLAVALLIVAFAKPILNAKSVAAGKGTLLIVVDNDWASARDWSVRQETMHHLIQQAERDDRDILLLPTAPAENGSAISLRGPFVAARAETEISHVIPEPWASNWSDAETVIHDLDRTKIADVLWIASGLGSPSALKFYDHLQQTGGVRVLNNPEDPIYTLSLENTSENEPMLIVHRVASDDVVTVSIAAYGKDDQKVANIPISFSRGAPEAHADLDQLPLDVRNLITRFEIDGHPSAATTFWLDSGWQKRSVGIEGNQTELEHHSLLSGLFYLDRALKPFADVHLGSLDDLIKQAPSVIIATSQSLNGDTADHLLAWVKKGGVLIRFADENFLDSSDPHALDLLPVILRNGDRALGGALTWSSPQKLQAFPSTSPFVGLTIPNDVTVTRQILAEPTADLPEKTWASLSDGTPLVTAKSLGSGISILYHIPAHAGWSTLPLSGLFVDMLRRITQLSQNTSHGLPNFITLPAWRVMNGLGDLNKPSTLIAPMNTDDFIKSSSSPSHPPGFYGSEDYFHSFNLGPTLGQPEALNGPAFESLKISTSEVDLFPGFLLAGFFLLVFDFLISLYLRGHITLKPILAGLLLSLLVVNPVYASTSDKTAVELTSKTWLAFIRTGDHDTDTTTEQGLRGLAHALARRTSVDQVDITGVDPNLDDLAFYPIIYWPLRRHNSSLTEAGVERVNDYLSHGGMIFFDTLLDETVTPTDLRGMFPNLNIPSLEALPANHTLHRSFYLLDSFIGRYTHHDFWVEADAKSTHDNVASVILSDNAFAAAWAVDTTGRFLFPCIPDGEDQREKAFRAGINLVMYALTGNYKSDQLHTDALLKRMEK